MQEKDFVTKSELRLLLSDHMNIFQTNVTRILSEKKISKTEFALRTDKEKQYLNYVLRHPHANPKIAIIVKMAAVLGKSISELFTA